jgi:hypothetical protein
MRRCLTPGEAVNPAFASVGVERVNSEIERRSAEGPDPQVAKGP